MPPPRFFRPWLYPRIALALAAHMLPSGRHYSGSYAPSAPTGRPERSSGGTAKAARHQPQMNLDMAIASHLRHYKQLQQRHEAQKTKTESIALRKDWLTAQKRASYQSEYDRIRGLLSQTILPDGAKRLKERETELKGLGIAGPSIMV